MAVFHRQQRAHGEHREQHVDLTEHQLVAVELAEHGNRRHRENGVRAPALGQHVDAQLHEQRKQQR